MGRRDIAAETCPEKIDGLAGDRLDGLTRRRDRWLAEFRKEDPVEAGYLYLTRYIDMAIGQSPQHAEGNDVGAADNRVGKTASAQELGNGLLAEVDRESAYQCRTGDEALHLADLGLKGFTTAAASRAGHENHPSCTNLHDVAQNRTHPERVVDADVIALDSVDLLVDLYDRSRSLGEAERGALK